LNKAELYLIQEFQYRTSYAE